jgi:biopolymer transport protein ExbD
MKRDTSLHTRVEIDLTPMIDVVFLLLIFFMCTLSFAVNEGRLVTHLPKDRGAARTAAMDLLMPLDLGVERDASRPGGVAVRVGPRLRVNLTELPGIIAAKIARESDLRVRISTEEHVTYGEAISVLDACVLGGLTDVSFTAIAL